VNSFESRYKSLNPAQKQAVDSIDGPLMVVAGPGTGKTELLSVRVANILRTTDALPQNILCLTFTESGAFAMRERLAGLIGAEAYKVAIHTFHSFGSEIMNRYGEYFYNGAHFRAADELTSYEVLVNIFEKLSHDNPLSVTMNGEYTYLRDVQRSISDLKKSGLTSDELRTILEHNDAYLEWLQTKLDLAFGDRLSKKSFTAIAHLAEEMANYSEETYDLITYEPLWQLAHASLDLALKLATTDSSTKPLSAWKREWCEKRPDGQLTLKDEKRSRRLRAVSGIYYDYLVAMQERALYDFDDMILRSVHALEVFTDLRLNLQEQYQYILVDEFQDTNDAQMRLLWNLTNNPLSEGKPNLMVVGDDDQAIYRFQGANLSNLIDFRKLYTDVKVIALVDNYRSGDKILTTARQTIVQATERLETVMEALDKTLVPHHAPQNQAVTFGQYPDPASEYDALAKQLAIAIKKRPKMRRAIIARQHKQLRDIIPYLQSHQIPLAYDRNDNVLESPPVVFLELLARVIDALAHQQFSLVNGLLPELLSHPSWKIEPLAIWKLSLDAHKKHEQWLETMLSYDSKLAAIAEWLLLSAHISLNEPLEYMLDHLTGTVETLAAENTNSEPDESEEERSEEDYSSPLRDYYFPASLLESDPSKYIGYLDALSAIRHKLREYSGREQLKLADFIRCIDRYRELGIAIQTLSPIQQQHSPVELLTAHRSKGLEFDEVYIIGLNDSTWGESSRRRAKLISYPHNLQIGTGGDTSDEHIRLLYVALTRAKDQLYLSCSSISDSGKLLMPVAYLSDIENTVSTDRVTSLTIAQLSWQGALTSNTSPLVMRDVLNRTLETYKLSATHLGNYLDVSRGGPELFLLQNLLRFPQAMSPSAAFGSAVHTTLQRAHTHLSATGKKRPVEDLLGDFEASLTDCQLSQEQFDHYMKRGSDVLSTFFAARYSSFSPDQRVEQSLSASVQLGEVRLGGAIDLMEIDERRKTIVVTDYKTGKSAPSWQGKTVYEKMKLHHYRQQLLFYKILIENSRQYEGFTVEQGIIEFVEPDEQGNIRRLTLEYDPDELVAFQLLIKAVWERIQSLNFSLPSTYEPTITGIEAFESDLVTNP
jgi:DNA helicase II / ATP-dependent DNA helicase PcrA